MNWSAFDNPQSLILGALMFVTAFLLWRNTVLMRRLKSGGPLEGASTSGSQLGKATSQLTHTASALQIELHHFLREVEGRMAHKTAALDEMLRETDAELERLEGLLEEQRQTIPMPGDSAKSSAGVKSSTDEPVMVSIKQRRMIGWLAKAGFNVEEIANFVQLDRVEVERCLNESAHDQSHRRAA